MLTISTPTINDYKTESNSDLLGLANCNKKIVNTLDATKATSRSLLRRKLTINSYDDFFINSQPKLADVPKIRLPDGTIANDYSSDYQFAGRMKQMSLEEAEKIKAQVNKYPENYPMPCMAITAKAINKSIIELHKQFDLTLEEQQLFNEISLELKQLFPHYPYKQSLIVAYKFLLYKSFLEYKFQLNGYEPTTKITAKELVEFKKVESIRKAIVLQHEIYTQLNKYAGITVLSIFHENCTLKKINNLPWDKLLANNDDFKQALFKIYFNSIYYTDVHASAFIALNSNEVLIPYTKALSIGFFNKTWSLPLWFVGYSVDQELTNADDYNMKSSGFFEHDLAHLAIKLYKTIDSNYDIFKRFLFLTRLIYKHKNLITATDFKSIELCLFYIAHERGLLFSGFRSIANALQQTYGLELIILAGIPVEYNTNMQDIKKACYFLQQLLNDNSSEYELLTTLAKKIDYSFLEIANTNSSIINNEFITVDPGNCKFIENIIEQIKYNKHIFNKYNFNSSRVIGLLRLYYKDLTKLYKNKKITLKTLKQQTIDEKILLNVKMNFFEEEQLILCFLQTNTSLNDTMRWETACSQVSKRLIEKQKEFDRIKNSIFK